MIQPQWPGLGPSYQPPSWGSTTAGATGFGMNAVQPGDGISSGWWDSGAGGYGSGSSGGSPSSLLGLLQSLIGLVGQLVGSLVGGSGAGSGLGYGSGGSGCGSGGAGFGTGPVAGPGFGPNGAGQMFANATLSSTGDPHLSETGTQIGPGGEQSVDQRFDSMTSHADLIDAAVPGGYRVSTTATTPDAKGVTFNQSATVHANCGRDAITMNRDGSYSVSSNGQALSLAKGQTLTLPGGETVTANGDGSLVVTDGNGNGGSISTTLRANGNGVDVTANAQQIRLGGDIVAHAAGTTAPPNRILPARDAPLSGAI
jgi:hypothetical protein